MLFQVTYYFCALLAPQSLLLVREMGKCHAENDSAPHAGCPPLLLLLSLAPSHPSLLPHQFVTSARSQPVTEQLGEEQISTLLLQLEAFPCGILSRLASALLAKALSHILRLVFTGPRCLGQSRSSPKYSAQMQITLSRGYGLYLHSQFKAQSI